MFPFKLRLRRCNSVIEYYAQQQEAPIYTGSIEDRTRSLAATASCTAGVKPQKRMCRTRHCVILVDVARPYER